jgi:hypothetical protein
MKSAVLSKNRLKMAYNGRSIAGTFSSFLVETVTGL